MSRIDTDIAVITTLIVVVFGGLMGVLPAAVHPVFGGIWYGSLGATLVIVWLKASDR